MALKALDIYKHLPKSNCAKCGSPTCLAFAMQLASKKVDLDQCPVITPEGRAALDEASSPPIRLVTIGKGDGAVKVGNETVLFRHDETFYHPTGLAVRIKDDESDEAIVMKIQAIEALKFERVGQKISVDMIAVEYASGDPDKYARTAVLACQTGLAPILMSKDLAAMSAAVVACADYRPLLHCADESNWREMVDMACKCCCPLAIDASDLEKASQLTQHVIGAGVEDIILDISAGGFASTLQALTKVRRFALKKNFRPLGFPCMAVPFNPDEDVAVVEASSYISKYAGIVVVDTTKPQYVLPMLTVRMNIYTDPRKPVQVEPKLYEIGAVNSESPLIITTNFSLTYYTVEGDVEASRIPCYIGVIDTEGTSVLTAWASEKLTVEKVVKLLNSEEVTSKISHRKVIVPGYVAVMSGKLTDESGWQVLVGPRESSGIPKFLKTMWKNA